jgi:putative CocE/NonD family hydrolase
MRGRSLRKSKASLLVAAAFFLFFTETPATAAQMFDFRAPASTQDSHAAAAVGDLASRLIPVYQDSDPERYLANLSALQMAVGDYAAADISRQSLRERRRKTDFGHPVGRAVIFDLYAHAKALETQDRVTFADAFTTAYRDTIQRFDDHDAFEVSQWLSTTPTAFRDSLQVAFDQARARDSIDEADAIELIWKYVTFDAYRNFGALVVLLNAENEHRRYTTDEGTVIRTRAGTNISITVTRPSNPPKAVPALLEFSSRNPSTYTKDSAAHGYAGVFAYRVETRKSSAGIDPFEFEGADAREVINWIAKQPWSDGRVGMYGEGWTAYAPWAAAKKLPPALKAIATSAAIVPGINIPMQGNIYQNAAYGWSLQMIDGEGAEQDAGDDAPWRALNEKWYRSGRPYRDLGRLYGKHNPVFIRWLNHPSYDGYWQKFVPYREQFAHLDIPVLTMTGYFAASEPGDLYYFTQHHRYNTHADHTLIIGPYDEEAMRSGLSPTLHGYQLDSGALIDLRELRFRWFDHVLKGAPAPALLADRVNYQVMGANEWRHAASVEAMANSSVRYYLDAAASGTNHRLSVRKRAAESSIQQTVSFTDRKDAAWTVPTDFISKSLAPRHGTIFVSEPLSKASTFSGLFSAHLDFYVNKMDMDLNITLYELLPNGDYVRLFSPTNEIRASYAADRVHRHLLKAGERQTLSFRSERLTSRQLEPGSRIAMVLSVSKRPDREINYGTGDDVSGESIADGKVPMKLRWYNDSFIDIPIGK